ncbi:potassium channel family protein [Streptomyces sp. NBC_00503]|uniref:potassium channel family protein n=1 Tax=Streptomyces sp. NBC_00503 TaxID=2903659 RepID=UPI002E812D34|nr:potassium channel family protein [Streptomyces sp. NBC_00503]WUD81173.1 potassium channel family protein [Streptomyces sp. NBC_00503]
MKEPSRQSRWERRTQTPLLLLALGFAVAYAVPIVAPDADPAVHRACTHAEWVVWAAFAVDYLMRLGLSGAKKAFVRTHWMDLAAVLLPMIQPLRLLRVVSTLMLVGRRARMAPQIRLTTYVAGAVVGLLMFGSLAVLSVERDAPGGNIKNLGDALWWSVTTMTTVGYGDHSPTTGLGRLLAVGLMLSGIALLGVVTANIAAWFISRFERDDLVERAQTAAIAELAGEVRALRAEIAALSATGPGGAPAASPDHGVAAQGGPPRAAGTAAAAPAPGEARTAGVVSSPTP